MQVLELEMLVERAAAELESEGRFAMTRRFVQHGGVTVYEHCVRVAVLSCRLAAYTYIYCRPGRAGARRAAARLLLYDWHEKGRQPPAARLHHPRAALNNACADWELSPRERNIILRHMFPLTPVPPACREGWLVCMADKICAVHEMIYTRTRRLRPALARR